MSRNFTLAAFSTALVFATLAAGSTASAQTVAYRHRSTIFGDAAAGASELVRAHGQFLVDESVAAQNWVQVVAAQDQIDYQRAEQRFQVKQMEIQYFQQKAEANRQRRQQKSVEDEAAGMKMLRSAKLAGVQWPTALTNAKFAGSMTLVESILRNWSPEDPSGDAYRRSLATEVGVLRTRVAKDESLSFASRVEAVKALSQLQQLANTAGQPATGVAAGPATQLAMR
jgi:hypothetical protein